MSLSDRLSSIYDSYSRRQKPRGKGYSPSKIEQKARKRVLLLLRDVYSGRWNVDPMNPQGDHTSEFWQEAHHLLQHLYGEPKLSTNPSHYTARDDAIGFLFECNADQFCDFLEVIFKIESTWRVVMDRNQLVDALNLILRSEKTSLQLTPVVTRRDTLPGGGASISTVALPKVVRVDEDVVYTEAILPALSVLADPAYMGTNDEFRKALAKGCCKTLVFR